jgi:hypothetical protein
VAPVYKFSNVGGFTSKTFYTSILAGNPKAELDNGSVFPLGEFTLASAQSSVTFSNIPQIYKNLQIRVMARSSVSDWASLKVNNDSTGTNYKWHYLYGTGSAAGAGAGDGSSLGVLGLLGNSAQPGVAIYDILDYTSTNKHKTIRILSGYDANGSGQIQLVSNLYFPSTIAAITRLDLQLGSSGQFQANSHFALYGVLT